MTISLKKEIVIEITILLVSALLFLGLIVLKLAEQIVINQKIKTSNQLTLTLQKSIIPILKENSFTTIQEVANSGQVVSTMRVFSEEEFSFWWRLIDMQGKVILSTKKEKREENLISERLKKRIRTGEVSLEKTDSLVSVTYPLLLNGKIVGAINGLFSLHHLKEGMRHVWKVAMMVVLFDAIVFIGFGVYLLARTVVKPLHELLAVASSVREGNFNRKAFVDSRNEIGMLADALNSMSDSLDEKITLLTEKNEELQEARNEVIQSEKLVSAGILAAGVAHEIGNPLSTIQTYIELLRSEEVSVHKIDILERMSEEGSRIDTIVRSLIALAMPSRGIHAITDINNLITGIIEMVKGKKAFEGISFVLELSEEIPMIDIDEQLLQQVIINLLLNASDAISSEGEIVVSSAYIISSSDQEQSIKILFSDNGGGIERKYLPKIFDPFFTTKEPGKGTGLGLSICHRIITDMRGKMSVRSVVSQGTTVEILLPCSKQYLNR